LDSTILEPSVLGELVALGLTYHLLSKYGMDLSAKMVKSLERTQAGADKYEGKMGEVYILKTLESGSFVNLRWGKESNTR